MDVENEKRGGERYGLPSLPSTTPLGIAFLGTGVVVSSSVLGGVGVDIIIYDEAQYDEIQEDAV